MPQPTVPLASAGTILRLAHAPALLVTNLINIRYLTGLDLSAGSVLIRQRSITLYADDRYLQSARRRAYATVDVKPSTALKSDLARLRSCAFEAQSVTIAQLARLKVSVKGLRLTPSNGAIEECRRAKSPHELTHIRKASRMTLRILRQIPGMLVPGVTERELAWRIASLAHDAGADGMAFDTIVAFGVHTSYPHHRPTEARLRAGDMVQIDMGVKVCGYLSDYSRVYFTRPPTEAQHIALKALRSVHRTVTPLVVSGVTTHALDRAARRALKRFGFDEEFCHALGHGVGLEIHEGVVVSSRRKSQSLKECEVVTIEPGLYFPGQWGMRIENTVIVQ